MLICRAGLGGHAAGLYKEPMPSWCEVGRGQACRWFVDLNPGCTRSANQQCYALQGAAQEHEQFQAFAGRGILR